MVALVKLSSTNLPPLLSCDEILQGRVSVSAYYQRLKPQAIYNKKKGLVEVANPLISGA